jgi:hypothetical protein
MPEACDRIRSFCERLGSDAPPEMMVRALQIQFVTERPEVICIVALGEAGLAGHLLANLERWGGKVRAHVLQLEIDDQAVPRREKIAAIRTLVGWARDMGAEGIQAFIPEQHFARLSFWKRLGFEQKYIVMRRPLDLALRAEQPAVAEVPAAQNERREP